MSWLDAMKKHTAEDLGAFLRDVAPEDKAHKKTAMSNLTVKAPLFHHGDFEVKGNLVVQAPLVVTGHLTVHKSLRDCGPDSRIAVGGNLRAANVYTSGDLFVGGKLTSKGIVYGQYNDNSLVAKAISARVVVADDHDIQAKVEAAELYVDIDAGEKKWKALAKLLSEDLTADGELDRDALEEAMLAGRPIFRAP
jgi:hypothetical protein